MTSQLETIDDSIEADAFSANPMMTAMPETETSIAYQIQQKLHALATSPFIGNRWGGIKDMAAIYLNYKTLNYLQHEIAEGPGIHPGQYDSRRFAGIPIRSSSGVEKDHIVIALDVDFVPWPGGGYVRHVTRCSIIIDASSRLEWSLQFGDFSDSLLPLSLRHHLQRQKDDPFSVN